MNNPFRNHYLTAKRKAGGAYSSGRWVEGTESDVAFRASVQPLSERELLALPEGRRTLETYKIFSDTQLNTVGSQNPDEVVLNGERFEVYSLGDWHNGILEHFAYTISKKQV